MQPRGSASSTDKTAAPCDCRQTDATGSVHGPWSSSPRAVQIGAQEAVRKSHLLLAVAGR
jgi:hypothetical protein